MNILTRGDMDGLTSAVLLSEVMEVGEVKFAHPKDVQDGLVPATEEDIVVNLPYIPGCGMWFDHHASEDRMVEDIGEFQGRFEVAPSCARVIYNHFEEHQERFEPYAALLDATDRLDAAQLSEDDVKNPSGWILLGLTLDPRSGLGPEFQKYFRWLVEYVKEVPIEKVLGHTEVFRRSQRVLIEQAQFEEAVEKIAKLDGNVIVTDQRGAPRMPAGNRFLIFTLFPQANVEMRIFNGKSDDIVVVAVGHSIFNRTCNVDVGRFLARYGGGGHRGAGTAQLDASSASEKIEQIKQVLQENKEESSR